MNFTFRKIWKKKNVRRLCSTGFLLLLFCEIASHAALDAHHEHYETQSQKLAAYTQHHDDHDDDCEPSIKCDDGSQDDSQSPNPND